MKRAFELSFGAFAAVLAGGGSAMLGFYAAYANDRTIALALFGGAIGLAALIQMAMASIARADGRNAGARAIQNEWRR